MDNSLPLVSIVMPLKNEGAYIAEALDRIDAQDYPRHLIEIIAVDGGSTDNTQQVIEERIKSDGRIRFVPGNYNCPAAMNAGIERANGVIVAKVDGHGYVNAAFLSTAVSYLREHPEFSCIGGEIKPLGDNLVATSNMLARFSKFGVGSGIYTSEKTIHEADTVQCGVYVKKHLEEVGNFDPDLQFGEDEEANFRLTKAGYRIVFHPGMQFNYYVRPSFSALFRQYRNYGRARVKVLKKYPEFFRIKHIVPSALVLLLSAATILPIFFQPLLAPALTFWLIYLSFLGVGALVIGLKSKFHHFHYLATSLAMLHLGYGIGMLEGVLGLSR